MTEYQTMNAGAAAKYLHIHPDTVKARARSGEIPAYMPGRMWVFYRHELDDYLQTTKKCRSIKGPIPKITIADLRSAEKSLDARLGPVTVKTPPNLRITQGT